jgi:phage tail tape-measure protein
VATGAAMGSMLGPVGTAVGGLAGAAYGTYKNWDTLTGPSNNKSAMIESKTATANKATQVAAAPPPAVVNNITNNNSTGGKAKDNSGKSKLNPSRNTESSIQRMTDRMYVPALA